MAFLLQIGLIGLPVGSRIRRRTAVRGIITHGSKILMVHTGRGDYKFPGGGMEPRESVNETLMREVRAGKPMLGICLGMQLLFEKSFEFGKYEGLSLVKGAIRPISDVIPESYDIPHIGWNALDFEDCELFKYIKKGDFVYFVHSFYGADCDESVIATTEYGARLTAAVKSGNVYGVQFHPEKSGDVGLAILKAFCEMEVK